MLSVLREGNLPFDREQTEDVCKKIEDGFAEALLQEESHFEHFCTETGTVRDWMEAEYTAYAPIWQEKMAAGESCRQDFDDFLNWRFHQIEFYFEQTDVKKQVIRLAEWQPSCENLSSGDMQLIPLVTSQTMYGTVYFGLLKQLVKPLAASVMLHKGYAPNQETEDRLSRLAVCILVDACHTVLRQELLSVYDIADWNLNRAADIFALPKELCAELEDCLLGME